MTNREETSMHALVILAEILACAFFAVSLSIDTKTLHSKYSFEPWSVSPYIAWGTTAAIIIPVLQIPLAAYSFFDFKTRVLRFLQLAACAVSLSLLVAGNVLASIETSRRVAAESAFAVKFNDFYCDARTLRMCLRGDAADVLAVTRGSVAEVPATENTTLAGLAVWSRCNQVLLRSIALEAKFENTGSDADNDDEIKREGEIEVDLNSYATLVDDCDNSRATDAWCGQRVVRAANGSIMADAEQRAAPSAFTANPSMFTRYKREWSKRMLFANVLLGTTIGSLLLSVAMSFRKSQGDT